MDKSRATPLSKLRSIKNPFSQLEICSQVILPHDRVSGQLFRAPLKQHFTLEEEVSAIRDTQRFVHVMVGNQNTNITVFEPCYNRLDILYRDGVDTRERFVQHNKLWIDSQATGNFGTATLSPRKTVSSILSYFL